jgi:hypothetical protein
MAIRPSYKLEPSKDHGLIEIERLSEGVHIEIHCAATIEEEPVDLMLTTDEASELAAALHSVLGETLSRGDAVTLGLDD